MAENKQKFLKDKNYAPYNLGDVCVVGLGKTGLVVANYFISLLGSRINSVSVFAGKKTKESMQAADKLIKKGCVVSFDDKTINKHFDLCVMSPGVPIVSDLYKSAKKSCTEVISEIELAWRESNKNIKWIAITGTNGKTTTASLIYHILNKANRRVQCVGNIGNVALEAVWQDTKKSPYNVSDYYVLEVSSYQLALTSKFAPYIAILLNITPDHISWHGSFDEYALSKIKIFDNASIALINVNDKVACSYIEQIESSVDVVIKNNFAGEVISVDYKGKKTEIISIDKLLIRGEHNIVNALSAASACVVLGIPKKQIAEGLCSFKPLEHRLEPCGIIAGVRIYNDSKATNVDAVMVAMDAFKKRNAIFLLGGRDKNTDLKELVKAANKKLKGVVCYGEASDRIYKEFKEHQLKNKSEDKNTDSFVVKKAENMRRAFYTAMEFAYPGDYVVLSPACASFDEFKNFEERGEVFKQIVNSLK